MDTLKYLLFQITPSEFEKLALDLLRAEGGSYNLSTQPEFDLLAANGEEGRVAVEVKHRAKVDVDQIKSFVSKVNALPETFSTLVYLTSAPMTPVQRHQVKGIAGGLSGQQLRVIDQRELIALLTKYRAIADRYLKPAAEHKRKMTFTFAVSGVTLAISVFAFLYSLSTNWNSVVKPEPSSFEGRINSVEQNLRGLKSLEHSLQGLKAELKETSAETARIQLEYEEALKLKSFTEEEIGRFRKATSVTSTMDTFLSYFYGFILGVSGSILATIITDRWKTWRALNRS